MTISAPASQTVSTSDSTAVRILIYSDNADVREQIHLAVGDSIGRDSRPIEWAEVATPTIAMLKCAENHYDLVIADNETTKLGGVGLVRQMRAELSLQPTVLLLLARQQDAWLAAWSGADAALVQPVDPFTLVERVIQLLGLPQD
ncbi:MAG: response regulator [Bifidobacteriaceae bacterium]|jgi:DNA-binding response OmpR family regulator|nr:response regulator [Bifidobacteriaceae bacterium]